MSVTAPIAKTVEVGKTINFNSTKQITASWYYQFVIDGSSTAVTRTPDSIKQNGGSVANVALSLTGVSATTSPVTVKLQQSKRTGQWASWSDVETYSVTVTKKTESKTSTTAMTTADSSTDLQLESGEAFSQACTWSLSGTSGNSATATVKGDTTAQPTLTITPNGVGTTTFTVKNSSDKDKYDFTWTVTVTVTKPAKKQIVLDRVTVAEGKTETVQADCTDTGTPEVSYNPTGVATATATLNGSKLSIVVTPTAVGSTTITIETANNIFTLPVTVTEQDPAEGTMNGEVTAYGNDKVSYTTENDWANMRLVYDASLVNAAVTPADDPVAQKGVVTILGLAEAEATVVKLYSGDTLVKTITVKVNKNDKLESITLMASETAEITTGEKVALKWVATPDELAGERLTITTERQVDSSAKVTITANGTAAAAKPAVIALYGDNVLVKLINVTITEKVDKDYLAENKDGSIVSYGNAKIVHAGETWTYTTVTKGSGNWTMTHADGTYKGSKGVYTLNGNFYKYMNINGAKPSSDPLALTKNADGTTTFSVAGLGSAGAKALILSIKNGNTEVMKVQIIVDQSVEDIKIKKGDTVTRSGTYTDSDTKNRHWAFDNDGSNGNVASLTLKYNGSPAEKTDLSLSAYPDFKWMTSSWSQDFTADISGNKLGSQVIRIARIYGTDEASLTSSFSTMYQYNVFVYDEVSTNTPPCKAGDVIDDMVFTSETAGAWEATSSDPTVVTVTEAWWTDTSFTPVIRALKEGKATLTVKNNFITYTVAVTVAKGKEIKNISIEKDGEAYVDDTIAGGASASSDDEGVATITLNSATKATIAGVAAGDAVCTVYDDGSNPIYEYNVKVYETKTADALVATGKTATVSLTSAKPAVWTAKADDETVVQVVTPSSGEATDAFSLQLKGLDVGSTTVSVENDCVKYTVDVLVSGDVKKMDLSLKSGETVATNLTFAGEVYWLAIPESGDDVMTVEGSSGNYLNAQIVYVENPDRSEDENDLVYAEAANASHPIDGASQTKPEDWLPWTKPPEGPDPEPKRDWWIEEPIYVRATRVTFAAGESTGTQYRGFLTKKGLEYAWGKDGEALTEWVSGDGTPCDLQKPSDDCELMVR